jgi:hypothetical protein
MTVLRKDVRPWLPAQSAEEILRDHSLIKHKIDIELRAALAADGGNSSAEQWKSSAKMARVSIVDIDAATNTARSAALTAYEFLLAANEYFEYQDRCGRRFGELFSLHSPWQQAIDRVASVVVSDQPGASIDGESLTGQKAWRVPGESYHQAAVTLAHRVFLTAWNAILDAHFRDPVAVPEPLPPLDLQSYWQIVRTALAIAYGSPRIRAVVDSDAGTLSATLPVVLFDLDAATAAINRESILVKQKLPAESVVDPTEAAAVAMILQPNVSARNDQHIEHVQEPASRPVVPSPGQPPAPTVPQWNAETGELTYNGQVVKRIKNRSQAKNVQRVLQEFQDTGWPPRIDDPLEHPASADRTNKTVRSLKAGLDQTAVQFSADGSGQGFCWKAVPRPRPNYATT